MTYEAHYGSFCNPLLWFIQHSMTEFLQDRDLEKEAVASWHSGYVPTNRLFADAVIDEIDRAGGGRVMLHDYHLYLAPRFIRNARRRRRCSTLSTFPGQSRMSGELCRTVW